MPADSRFIEIADDAAALPEDLLLAQAAGKVLFLAGAGVSMGDPARLPDFSQLVRKVYEEVDPSVRPFLDEKCASDEECASDEKCANATATPKCADLTPEQRAEVSRFHRGDLDVTLGLLERRLEGEDPRAPSAIRAAVRKLLPSKNPTPAHRALMRLSDRGDATAILTTNFDLLFERCRRRPGQNRPTYGIGGMPRPSTRTTFTGIFHVHGVLSKPPRQPSDILLTDRDFGEHYYRRRFVPDFLYDVSRLYSLVLVGYSADDPPMRYLLNAIAADTLRFPDLQPRYIFVGGADALKLSDLKGRGLIPIPYSNTNNHEELTQTLKRWASIAPLHASQVRLRSLIRRAVRVHPDKASSSARDLVSHLLKRSTDTERRDLANVAGRTGHVSWLTHLHSSISKFYRTDAERRQRALSQVTHAFLRRHLHRSDRRYEALQWGTTNAASDPSVREAISVLIDDASVLPASWRTAWRWVRDSWSSPRHSGIERYQVADRVRDGDRSDSLVHDIARLVEPPLRVEMHDPLLRELAGPGPMRALWVHFGRVPFVTLIDLHLDTCAEPSFLLRVVHTLDSRLTVTMDTLRRIHGRRAPNQASNAYLLGLDGADRIATLGCEDRALGNGAGPLIHLLYRALLCLSRADRGAALRILRTWRHEPTFIHRRLWASVAMNASIVTGREVGAFMSEISRTEFWDAEGYPEIAELRAKRFADLTPDNERSVASMLRRRPPRFRWLRDRDEEAFSEYCERRTLGEFRRITGAGGRLSARDVAWMRSRKHIKTESDRADDLDRTGEAVWVGGPEPDGSFDLINDADLLCALDAALKEEESRGPEGIYGAAGAWVARPVNWPRIIRLLEVAEGGAAAHGSVWNCFGWRHRPLGEEVSSEERDLARRVLSVLAVRSVKSVNHDISGICWWFSRWDSVVTAKVDRTKTAFKYWGRAVEATSRRYFREGVDWVRVDEHDLLHWNSETLESRALNNPAGQLAGVLVNALPKLDGFGPAGEALNLEIRDALVAPRGPFSVFGRWYLARRLSYLWGKDRAWTQRHIVRPMLDAEEWDLSLWIGFVRGSSRTALREIIERLGPGILERAGDGRLDLKMRQSLAVLAVRYFVFAFWGNWDRKLSKSATRQMLRAAEVDLLVYVTHHALLGFLDSEPAADGQEGHAARAERFRRSVGPVLREVWPQERTRDRPSVAKAMAQIPAAAGSAFSDAYHCVKRFLCPFRVYTIRDYGFGRTVPRGRMFDWMESRAEAGALLSLLNLTVGEGEEVRAPLDVDEALGRIRTVAPPLAQGPAFRRLETLQRRSPFE